MYTAGKGHAGWESALFWKALEQNDTYSWFTFTCKNWTDKNGPTVLGSFLLGYGQWMYHASANFCDA